jgi:hypothetical protein
MRTLDAPFVRRWIMWAAVRLGALANAHGRKGWLGPPWRVLPFAIVALPIVLLAAAVIVVTLPAFHPAEPSVWLALPAGRRIDDWMGLQPAKQVNKPGLRLRLQPPRSAPPTAPPSARARSRRARRGTCARPAQCGTSV